MSQDEPWTAEPDAADREGGEAACLRMLADADEQLPQTAIMASANRAFARELEMEVEFLRARAAGDWRPHQAGLSGPGSRAAGNSS